MHFKPRLLIFDVNETLLDLKPMKVAINHALANELAFDIWFSSLLHYSLVESISGKYQDFGKIGAATLKMTAEKFDKQISDGKIKDVLSLIKKLPPHPDVVQGLTLLKNNGIKMVALTNGTLEVVKAQLQYAEIDHFFDEIFSVESLRFYKPHPATYTHVVKEMKASPIYSMLIAAHGWDIAGAQRAGLMTGFVSRPGKFPYPLAEVADISGSNVLSIAKTLV
ncbi:haloacid dehalogenase type II [Flavobacteriaceae bacterium KMM 6897]|nr:haloacid dehalogenase type II [Flavobacteriaceae bacterium KMM 6897]MEB8345448.1 haloacid dehalogenase type II [Flavobacteriaceae bacterium KMM 6898]